MVSWLFPFCQRTVRTEPESRPPPSEIGLIDILLDSTAPYGDRHDAAMDLVAFDRPDVIAALLTVACAPTEDEALLDACGESLGEIWARSGSVPHEQLARLMPVALSLALAGLPPDALQRAEAALTIEFGYGEGPAFIGPTRPDVPVGTYRAVDRAIYRVGMPRYRLADGDWVVEILFRDTEQTADYRLSRLRLDPQVW